MVAGLRRVMRSANEIAGLVLKAARGAGLPLGACEELARAAPVLAGAGRLNVVLDCLQRDAAVPEFREGVFRGGHPVLIVVSWLDLEAAGVGSVIGCDIPEGLVDALKAARTGARPAGPMAVEAALWQELSAYAEKTFVPETEASRLAGAGAGLTDND